MEYSYQIFIKVIIIKKDDASNFFNVLTYRGNNIFRVPVELIKSYLLLLLWFICHPPIKDIVLALAGLYGFLVYLFIFMFCTARL